MVLQSGNVPARSKRNVARRAQETTHAQQAWSGSRNGKKSWVGDTLLTLKNTPKGAALFLAEAITTRGASTTTITAGRCQLNSSGWGDAETPQRVVGKLGPTVTVAL